MSSRENLSEGTGHSRLWPILSKWPFSSPVSKLKKFDTHVVQSRMAFHRNTPEESGHAGSCGQNIPVALNYSGWPAYACSAPSSGLAAFRPTASGPPGHLLPGPGCCLLLGVQR
uniref:(northern house mosquito) hypothetical protein n=1 Tax=Culex pipiens TaxID=7175 RepID=A0A8D8FV97_CULPI